MKNDSLYPQMKRRNLDYWVKKFPENIHPTNLRLDFQRPIDYQGNIGVLELKIDRELSQKMINLANSEPFLIYSILMAALNICLYKYKKGSDILVGSPVLKGEGGAFNKNNAIAIINKIRDKCSFKELLLDIKDNLLESYKWQDYSYDELIKELALEHITNKCPIFDITLALKNLHHELPVLKNDLSLSFNLEANDLSGTITYNENLFYQETIAQFFLHYSQVLRAVLQKPDILISDVSLISEAEAQELIFAWNSTDINYPADKCLHQLFEALAEKSPQASALVCGTQKLSYGELNDQSNQLAHHLQNLGVKPNSMVGLFVERSVEMVIGLLGVLKSGSACIPLDPLDPANTRGRIAAMVKTENIEIFLTKVSLVSLFNKLPKNEAKIICLDYDSDTDKIAKESKENCVTQTTVNDLAYVIFTSGSTEVPTGAGVYHKGWTNLLYWFTKEFEINPQDRNLIISSFSFDITQRAVAMSLISGGELHLLDSNYYDPRLILKTIDEEQITLMNCAPSAFYPLIEDKEEDTLKKLTLLRLLFLSGGSISASRLKNWAESQQCNAKIVNLYGIEECSEVSSFYVLNNYEQYVKSSVPAGKPIFNTQIYILDEDLNLVPKGLIGEICIAGDAIGKGFINDEKLTNEKFVQNPFKRGSNEKLYRTGDLGRLMPDGNIEFIGPIDQRIEIEGLPIYTGNIETAIRQNHLIKEGVVIHDISGHEQRLIAYLIREKGNDNLTDADVIKQVQEFLNKKLSNYMVPHLFFVLDELPLTLNGKFDPKALPNPDALIAGHPGEDKAESGEVEKLLLKIFADILKISEVGIDDNFFEIGGHSLLAAQVISSISASLNVELVVIDLLANPTARRFAGRIRESNPLLA